MDPSFCASSSSMENNISSASFGQPVHTSVHPLPEEDSPKAELNFTSYSVIPSKSQTNICFTDQVQGLQVTDLSTTDPQDGNWHENKDSKNVHQVSDLKAEPIQVYKQDEKRPETIEATGQLITKLPPSLCYDEDTQYSRTEPGNGNAALSSILESVTSASQFCSLCDDITISEGHCTVCTENLCAACISRHGKMSLTAHHNIFFYSQEHEDGYASVANSVQSVQKIPHNKTMDIMDHCKKHIEEKLRFYCKNCQKPVCRDCILTSHKQHLTEDIDDVVQAAKSEMLKMMGQLEEKKHLLESYLNIFEEYKIRFEQNVQEIENMVKSAHQEIIAAADSSFIKLTEDLKQCRLNEINRIQEQETTVHKNIQDMSKLLSQQSSTESSSLILSQHEVLSHALKTLEENVHLAHFGGSEFFVSKKITVPKHLLGTITLMPSAPPLQLSLNILPKTIIHEVILHRELAFNIWEMNCSKSSICSIVETPSGIVWVATSHSLLKMVNNMIKDSINIPDNIAEVAAGPGDKLLVSFGQGSSVKLYANGSWSGFACVPKGSTVIASKVQNNTLQFYVAVKSLQKVTKILSYSTDGQICHLRKLPQEVFQSADPENINSSSSEINSLKATGPANDLKLSCMAVGPDNCLCMGDIDGRQLIIIDEQGHLIGQYRGPDGQTGCQPASICVLGSGKVVLADSYRSTVELISLEGNLLASLLTREHFQDIGAPRAVMVDNKGQLWVGTSMGHVSAYIFLHTH